MTVKKMLPQKSEGIRIKNSLNKKCTSKKRLSKARRRDKALHVI